jgi:hypothetical protein
VIPSKVEFLFELPADCAEHLLSITMDCYFSDRMLLAGIREFFVSDANVKIRSGERDQETADFKFIRRASRFARLKIN